MPSSHNASNSLGHTAILSHQDLDGFVTAALLWAYIADQGEGVVDVDFVDFPMKERYGRLWEHHLHKGERSDGSKMRFDGAPDTVIIGDFPLTWVPPGINLIHVDHHKDITDVSLIPPDMARQYNALAGRKQPHPLAMLLSVRRSGAPSAADLVRERVVATGWILPPELDMATQLATQVDTLRFPNVASAMKIRSAPMIYDFAVRNLPPEALRTACEALAGGMSLQAALIYPNVDFLNAAVEQAEREIDQARAQRQRVGLSGSAIIFPTSEQGNRNLKLCHYEDPAVRYGITMEISADFPSGARVWSVRANMAKAPNWGHPAAPNEPDFDMRQAITEALGMGGGHPFSAGATYKTDSYGQAVAWAREAVIRLGSWLAQAEQRAGIGRLESIAEAGRAPPQDNGRISPRAPLVEYPKRGGSPHTETARCELGPTR